MDLVVLLVADYANVEKADKLNVMGIFGQIAATKFPARHPEMYLVARLSASPAEYGRQRKLTIKLLDEDATQEIVNWSRQIEVSAGSGQNVDINQILRLTDLVFERPGLYRFYVLVDDDVKGSIPIRVVAPDESRVE